MRKSILIALLFLNFQAFCQTSNFSGNWIINKSKIDFGDLPEYVLPTSLKVDHRSNSVTISRKVPFNGSISESSFTLFYDDKTKDTVSSTGVKITGLLKNIQDRTKLTVFFQIFNGDGTLGTSVTEVWSLIDDGKTLLIDRHVEESEGLKYDIKGYYDKQ